MTDEFDVYELVADWVAGNAAHLTQFPLAAG
jgi:hypothetical protein